MKNKKSLELVSLSHFLHNLEDKCFSRYFLLTVYKQFNFLQTSLRDYSYFLKYWAIFKMKLIQKCPSWCTLKFTFLSIKVNFSIYLLNLLFIYLFIYSFIYLSIYLFIYLFVYLFIYLLIYLFIYLLCPNDVLVNKSKI